MKKSKLFFIAIFLVLFAGVFGLFYKKNLKEVKADSLDNISGFVWSSSLGWVSFNCNNSELPLPRCANSNYGVNIEDNGSTGIFFGNAWSSNVGWINFDSAVGCPDAPAPCQRVIVDKKTGAVSGWAKILTTGEWLHLKGTNYGVSISKSTREFSGYAWGGENIGWISFSCDNGGLCPLANYRLTTTFDMNIKPTVTIVSGQNPILNNVCSDTPAFYEFSWEFSDEDTGDTQSKYQVQVAKTSSNWVGWVAGVDEVDTGVLTSGTQSKDILLASGQLSYNKDYKWRVMVWDNNGGASGWAYGTNFSSPDHVYPLPKFTHKPQLITKDQLIQFCSIEQTGVCDEISTCYGVSYPSCSGANFVWTLPLNAEIISGITANPVIKFKDSGDQSIFLKITDDVGACSTSTSVRVTLPLPKWQEVLPQ